MPLRPLSRDQAWILPPSLDELVPQDHAARFVAEFVDALGPEDWARLGVRIDGAARGGPAYHPRLLLSVWLHGFMSGVRSSRKLEAACREQLAYMWLTGQQFPDHNTLWRFYARHREAMRALLERTVRTAVAMGLVNLAVQAVDGTKVGANASLYRTRNAEELGRLLERLEFSIADLEARNEAGEGEASAALPQELAGRRELRERVREALTELGEQPSGRRINLTDRGARLMKTPRGIIPGYNAQAMVSGAETDGEGGGMLITAASVVDAPDDHGQLLPMLEQARAMTGAVAGLTLADAGYHSGYALEDCERLEQRVVMPESRERVLRRPYGKQHFRYESDHDRYICPEGQPLPFHGTNRVRGEHVRQYRASGEGSFQELRSAHLPRFTISGHTTETLRILEADIVSEPYDGAAYAAGEHIEVRIILNGPVRPLATPLTVPLYLGPGAEHRRDARLVTIRGNYTDVLTPQDRRYVLYFAYTVQPGDVDTDGIVLGANLLGQAADRRIEYAMDPRVKMDLAFPAREPGASQRVDGSQTSSCDAVHCAIVTAVDAHSTESSTAGYFGLADDLVDGDDRLGNMSGRLFIYGGQEYVFMQVSVDAKVLDDGTVSSRPDFWFTQPLQSQAVDRLGIELEGRAFALEDILAFRFSGPTIEEHGFEHYEGYGWSTTGLLWRADERRLFKVVEMPVTASYDASTYATDEGDTLEVTVTLEGSFELETVTLPLVATGNAGATDADYLGVPAELVFAPGETGKQFTITIVQDDLDDDDETVTLSFGTLPDTVKTGGEHETATITIQDDDDPEITVTFEHDSYDVAEGGSATVKVTLSADPERDITIPVTTTLMGGASAADYAGVPAELAFATGETEQTFTVMATQDEVDDDDERVVLGFGKLPNRVTEDSNPKSSVNITDDDTAALVLSEMALTVDEGDAAGRTYTVKLGTEPTADVTVTVTGHADTDLTLRGLSATNTLTFTTSNWNTAQTVTVKAAQDADAADDTVTLTHTAAGAEYDDLTASLKVTVVVDDTAAIVLSAARLAVGEGDTSGESYTVKLSHVPTASVTVTVSGHAGSDVSLDKTSMTFTTSNWSTAQTVTVKAAEDADAADDTVTLTHTAAGAEYDDLTASLEVTVDDDETAAIVLSKSSLSVDEGDTTGGSYTVKLSHVPTASVTVTVSGHAGSDVSLDKTSMTFTTSNWSTAQTVTVKAAEDADAADDTVTLTHTAAGAEYDDLTASLEVTVDDDETAAIVLSKSSLSVDEGDTTGGSYTVKLSHVPTASVTVTVSGHAASDVSVDDTSLTFTTSNWNSAQTVTVKAAQDADAADDTVTLTHSAAGAEYAGATASLGVTVDDDETAGVTITPTALTVLGGGSNSYTVTLTSEPAGNVTVTASGHVGSDLSLDQTALTFTTSNWNTAQTITVSATDAAASASVSLAHAVASSADSVYNALSGRGVSVTVVPTGPSIQVVQLGVTTSRQELTVPEGGSDTYSVVLSHVPTADVTLTITDPSDNTEASASPDSLTFTTSNWNTAQTVTVSAAEDDDAVADPVATVTHSLSGGGYDDVTVPDVEVTIIENDSPSIVLSADALSVAEGDTTGKTYTVELATQPSASVTVTVSGHAASDVSVDDTSLTFTTSNWNTAQTVTVTAAHDADAAGDTVTLTHTAAGAEYDDVSASLDVTGDDDETAAIVLSKSALSVGEGDTTGGSYTVKLSHVPTASVTVTVSGHAASDVSVDDTSLTFTTSNWNTAQTVTVKAAQDADAADDTVTLTHTAAGAEYDDLTASLKVTVDDTTDIAVSFDQTSYSATEGGSSATVTVELSAPAPRQVEIPLTAAGHDGATQDDWSGVPVSLTFDVGDTSASFTVTAFDDTEEDDGEMVELGFGALPSGFVAGTPVIARVALTNDDETVIPDCGDAIWCATVTFRTFDRGIVNASMSDSDFVYDGVLYEVGGVRAERSLQPGVTPSPPFRIPERSWFSFNFYECRTQQSRSLPEASLQTHDGSAPPHVACKLSTHNHYRDWTLFIEYDAVSVALPFDAARQLGQPLQLVRPGVLRPPCRVDTGQAVSVAHCGDTWRAAQRVWTASLFERVHQERQ